MSKHTNSDFNWNNHEAEQSAKQVHKLMYKELNRPSPDIIHIIEELAMGAILFAILTSSLWLPATGWIKG